MPTPFESAQLILTLYDLRREETMRKARDFFVTFDPRTFEDFMASFAGPHSAYIRMVVSYWEMAASLVANGAIDARMFTDANGEFVFVFGKVEPFLPQFREVFGNPNFLVHLEKLTLGLPNGRQLVDESVQRMRAMMAARAAAQSSS
ncbi:MAG: hypothetical protein ABSB15_00810 [Bryobacteraceae bacterium]|jgi:hypothetical protein